MISFVAKGLMRWWRRNIGIVRFVRYSMFNLLRSPVECPLGWWMPLFAAIMTGNEMEKATTESTHIMDTFREVEAYTPDDEKKYSTLPYQGTWSTNVSGSWIWSQRIVDAWPSIHSK